MGEGDWWAVEGWEQILEGIRQTRERFRFEPFFLEDAAWLSSSRRARL